MKVSRRLLPVIGICTVLVGGALTLRSPAAAAGLEQLPDLQTVVPTTDGKGFSIDTTNGREFRYTHLIYNPGPGTLEVQPAYDTVSGGYRGEQLIYNLSGSQWSLNRRVRVPDTFVFHAAHGHFHFPLASFGLYRVGPGDSIGEPVALSPKIGFCIDDSYIYNASVPHAGTMIGNRGSCADPSSLRGISIGGADEYDYRDPGQAIPIDGLPDGTYWFKAVSDPYNDFAESNEGNNETDVKVTIQGNTVTAGASRTPDTTPPTGSLNAPAEGAVLRGTSWLTATSLDGDVASVSFVVDGTVVGVDDAAPFTVPWDSTAVVDGSHWFAARITDRAGRTNTTPVHAATVSNAAVSGAGLTLVGSVTADGRSHVTTRPLSQLQRGDRLVALVSSDGPDTLKQAATVSSATAGGPAWTRVGRANAQPGSAEVWTAAVPAAISSIAATATLAAASDTYDVSVTVLAFRGAAGIGAFRALGGTASAPGVDLTTTSGSSRVYAVGTDWDKAAARTVPSDQEVLYERLTGSGDTFWSQGRKAATGAAGTTVRMNVTAPVTGHWNLAAVEVTSVATADTTAPRVTVTDPIADATLTGNVRVAATAADNVGVSTVDFLVDGRVVGSSTKPPYVIEWNSKAVPKGAHLVSARARDAAGNIATSAAVSVRVDNSGRPPAVIAIDSTVLARGTSTLTTPPLTTGGRSRLLLALVALDGPEGGDQGSTVSGGGLRWSLVNTIGTQTGAAQIWSAYASQQLRGTTITATPTFPGYDGQLTVMAVKGAAGTGVSGVSARQNGAPSIYLPGVSPASWVVAVGNDSDGAVARTPAAGQKIDTEWVHRVPPANANDPDDGATFWVQSLIAPTTSSGLVTLSVTSPTTHQWNLAAVEVKASGVTSLRPGRPRPDPDLPLPRPTRPPVHHR